MPTLPVDAEERRRGDAGPEGPWPIAGDGVGVVLRRVAVRVQQKAP